MNYNINISVINSYLTSTIIILSLAIFSLVGNVRAESFPRSGSIDYEGSGLSNQEKDKNENKNKDKANKKKEKQKKEREKQELKGATEYDRLRREASAKLADNDLFKLRVEETYKELRRQHSEIAFRINTFDSNDERVTFTGDKLKTEDTLYDNSFVQDYINRVGQALVPEQSRIRLI